jgi:hypothetical protein
MTYNLVSHSDGAVDISEATQMWPEKLRWYHRERMYELRSGYFRRVWNPECDGGMSCWFPDDYALKWFVGRGYQPPARLKHLIKS